MAELNKADFVQELGELLKKTSAYEDLIKIEYKISDDGFMETVNGYFGNGTVSTAYVTCDSNIAIITDVIIQWR